ncbi:Uncharacterised protein [Paenibacillus thiaminolyticus]|nr:Uncharacterised protein [Paenibacillus thiaminolyticus]
MSSSEPIPLGHNAAISYSFKSCPDRVTLGRGFALIVALAALGSTVYSLDLFLTPLFSMMESSDVADNKNTSRRIRIRIPMNRVMNKMNKISIARAQRIGYGACALSIILWVRGRLAPAPKLAAAYRLRREFPVYMYMVLNPGVFSLFGATNLMYLLCLFAFRSHGVQY